MIWRRERERTMSKPFGQRKLSEKLYIVCTDPNTDDCEIVRWLENGELNVSPLLEKGIELDTHDEYIEYCEICQHAFPNLKFYVTSEKYLPEITRLPELDGVVSRPLGKYNQ